MLRTFSTAEGGRPERSLRSMKRFDPLCLTFHSLMLENKRTFRSLSSYTLQTVFGKIARLHCKRGKEKANGGAVRQGID